MDIVQFLGILLGLEDGHINVGDGSFAQDVARHGFSSD